jgi:molybdopterin-guanine dinucleotide biosynthesis protein A
MGRDKALLDVGGRPLIARLVDRLGDLFDEIVIGAGPDGGYGFLGRPVAADREPGQGPLMGIASCLEGLTHDLALVTACDIPFPDLRFAAALLDLAEGYDMVLPRAADGACEPLFAVYRRTVVPAARALLAAGRRSILGLRDKVRTRIVPLPPGVRLGNINTLDDFRVLAGTRRPDRRTD